MRATPSFTCTGLIIGWEVATLDHLRRDTMGHCVTARCTEKRHNKQMLIFLAEKDTSKVKTSKWSVEQEGGPQGGGGEGGGGGGKASWS